MSDAVPGWVQPFVGLPYRAGGRKPDGVDCWGLVRLVFRARAGLRLPAHVTTRDVGAAFARAMAGPDWVEVETPHVLDVVVMLTTTARGPAPLHVGLMVSDRLMLHIDEGCLSYVTRIAAPDVAPRVDSFWRFAARNQ